MNNGFCGYLFTFCDAAQLIELAAEAGFTHISLSAQQISQALSQNADRSALRELCWTPESAISLTEAGEIAAQAGVNTLVLPAETAESVRDELYALIQQTQLQIGFENGYGGENDSPFEEALYPVYGSTAKDLIELTDAWNTDTGTSRFFVCLNTGHAALCKQELGKMVWELQGRLRSMHANDNHGRNDYHLMPFRGRAAIAWPELFAALAQTQYHGTIYLDVNSGASEKSPVIAHWYMKTLYSLGENIIETIEKAAGS